MQIREVDTILMFSGGLDSCGAFWQLMQEGRKVLVYHMHLKNIENRHEAEAVALEAEIQAVVIANSA